MPSVILSVGQDPMVLSTRCSILRSAGYLVRPSSSIAEAIDLFDDLDVDLVLLCHSISVQDRDRTYPGDPIERFANTNLYRRFRSQRIRSGRGGRNPLVPARSPYNRTGCSPKSAPEDIAQAGWRLGNTKQKLTAD